MSGTGGELRKETVGSRDLNFGLVTHTDRHGLLLESGTLVLLLLYFRQNLTVFGLGLKEVKLLSPTFQAFMPQHLLPSQPYAF